MGEVFFRLGTESTRLNHEGLKRVVEQQVRIAEQRWQQQNSATLEQLAAQLRAGFAGQRLSTGPAAAFSLSLEPQALVDAAIEPFPVTVRDWL